jgi:hypothetical protein
MQENFNFPAFAILADESVFLCREGVGGGGGVAQDLRKTQKLPQKVSEGKRSLSIIYVHCRLCI